MSSDIDIRRATPEDLPLILEFIKAIAAFAKRSNEVSATEASLKDCLFGENPAAEVCLAFQQDQAIGYAVFFHNFSTFAGKRGLYLEDLFIKSEFRGVGAGTAILKYLAHLARERDCARFEWVVLDWNEHAIRFYKRMGAQVMPEWNICRMDQSAIKQFCISME